MKNIIGPLLVVLLFVGGSFTWKIAEPHLQDMRQIHSSDAAIKTKGHIRIDGDDWVGYFIVRSPKFIELMRHLGWIIDYHHDKADYTARMERNSKGDSDFMVLEVGSYILSGNTANFPGRIIMAVDESKGGDAILASKASGITNLSDIKGKKIKVAITLDTPSHIFAKAVAEHFDVPELLANIVPANSSNDAFEKLLNGEVDLAIGWEPGVSRTLNSGNGIVKILGTEDTDKVIVDALAVNWKFAKEKPEVVKLFIKTYFEALKFYTTKENHDTLIKDLTTDLKKYASKKFSPQEIATMLKGFEWINFNRNCSEWFGVGSYNEGMRETIDSTVKILMNAKDFQQNPLPNSDAYTLLSGNFLDEMFKGGIFAAGFASPNAEGMDQPVENSIEVDFEVLSDADWNKLETVGPLKMDGNIVFQTGKSDLNLVAKELIDNAVERLKRYPNYRLVIKGHTANNPDPAQAKENMTLSKDRADAVSRYLEITHGVDLDRMRVIGVGGNEEYLVKKNPGETSRSRSWIARLSRVEIILVKEKNDF